MEIFLLQHVSHTNNTDGVHHVDGEIRIDEQLGDDVKLLGCYSTEDLAHERIARARLSSGFIDEPDCFIVDRYVIDKERVDGRLRHRLGLKQDR